MSTRAHRFAAAAFAAAAPLALSACTTTQERSAALAQQAEGAAEAKRFNVGRTNSRITAEEVTTLKGDGANTVVVKLKSEAAAPQALVPIGVDLYDAKGTSLYTNRVDGLDAALNNVPVAEPGTTWWVNNQLPGAAADRTRVRVGTPKAATPAELPELKVSGIELGDDAGIPVATGKVENLSAVEQRRLTIFAVALKGGKVVAAGRAVVEKVGPKGSKRQRFSVYFTGDPTGAQLEISAPPSTLGDA